MQQLPPLKLCDYMEQTRLVEHYIRKQMGYQGATRILEAGCGHQWELDLRGVNYRLTGLDLDKEALEIRKNVNRDLDECIHGDLRYANLGAGQFDVIYCAYVLEHIREAEVVMLNFSRWLRKGGLLILFIPDAHSVRGFITRITPHWFHVLYYRHVLRIPHAGKPGHGPYVTYYAPVVSRQGIREFCEQHRFGIIEERAGGSYLGRGFAAAATRALMRTMSLLSLGRLSDEHADLMYMLVKE